jgi:PhnB protein
MAGPASPETETETETETLNKRDIFLLSGYNTNIDPAMSRVTTYLNFGRNTEEAFNFYKSVFGGEFTGAGIGRMKDIPATEDMPALSEDDKNLVMHVELPILGGHLLRGTDAPESMGFNLIIGNNVHINLEPDTRAETKKLFDALSSGGKITMELQDMFWGAYYGSCTDKFGVQWMFNCNQK